MPGEPVFVAAEGAKSEDDGYLMTFVYEAETDTSRFVVMDAADDGRHAGRVDRAAPGPVRVPRQLDRRRPSPTDPTPICVSDHRRRRHDRSHRSR